MTRGKGKWLGGKGTYKRRIIYSFSQTQNSLKTKTMDDKALPQISSQRTLISKLESVISEIEYSDPNHKCLFTHTTQSTFSFPSDLLSVNNTFSPFGICGEK